MASKKILSGNCILEILFNEDSEDSLFPESNSSQSSGSERPESEAVAMISDISDEAMLETLPSCCPPLPPFTANVGLNTDIENADVMSFVKLFITDNFLEYIRGQTSLYASQVISAAPRPFTEHSLFQTWALVTVPELKKLLWLMFVTRIIDKLNLKRYSTDDHVFETPNTFENNGPKPFLSTVACILVAR
jgi:hypothetical protein